MCGGLLPDMLLQASCTGPHTCPLSCSDTFEKDLVRICDGFQSRGGQGLFLRFCIVCVFSERRAKSNLNHREQDRNIKS